jgi:glycosyl transferase family 87
LVGPHPPRQAPSMIEDTYPTLILALATAGLLLRFALSAASIGTNDVVNGAQYAATVQAHGALGLYHVSTLNAFNNPPLLAYLFVLVNQLATHGVSVPFAIRVLPILADFMTTIFVAEIFHIHSTAKRALLVGGVLALNPVLVPVSGFHGNFDTVFCALMVMSLYFMVERKRPVVGGLLGAAAVGIKLVPIVLVPLIIVSTRKWKDGIRYLSAFLIGSALIWVPALVSQFHGVVKQVFGYRGLFGSWGVEEFATMIGVSHHVLTELRGPLGFATAAFSAIVGVWLFFRSRVSPYMACGLILALVLLLLPGWSAQYMSWPVALAFFIDLGLGLCYTLAAGAFLFQTYTVWSNGFPWHEAHATQVLGKTGIIFGLVAWIVLAFLTINAFLRAFQNIHDKRGHVLGALVDTGTPI